VAQQGKLHLPRVMMRRVNLDLPPESLLKKELEGSFAATLAMRPLPSSNFWLLLPGCFPPSASPVTTSYSRTIHCYSMSECNATIAEFANHHSTH